MARSKLLFRLLLPVLLVSLIPVAAAQTTSVNTNRSVYLPGQLVTISGTVSPAQSIAVGVEVRNPNGQPKFIKQVTSAGDGSWSTSFRLSSSAATGTWTVYATPSGGTRASTTFLVGQIATVTITSVVATVSTTITTTSWIVSYSTIPATTTVLAPTTQKSVITELTAETTETIPSTRTVTTAVGMTSLTRTETISLVVSVTATEVTTKSVTTTLTHTSSTVDRVTETVEKVEILYVLIAFLIPAALLGWLYVALGRRR